MQWRKYRRKGISEMRPYIKDENLDGVSLSDEDKLLSTLEGGFVARDPQNHNEQWYVSK